MTVKETAKNSAFRRCARDAAFLSLLLFLFIYRGNLREILLELSPGEDGDYSKG
jgi:hypothetical protein